MAAQQKSNRRSSRGMSPGRSMAQFGHAGHAGKSQSKAQKHQKAGINTPSRGPGSNPNMGQTPPRKTATVSTPKKTTAKKGITATKAAGKTAKELAYWKSLGRLFAGDPTPALKMIGGQYVWDKSAPIRKGLGSAISNFFFSPAGAAEIDFSKLPQATESFTPDFGGMLDPTSVLKSKYTGKTRGDFADAVTSGKFGPGGKQMFKRNVGDLFEGVDLGAKSLVNPFATVEPTLIGTQDGSFQNVIDINEKKLEEDALKTLQGQGVFVNKADGGLINLFKYGGFLG